MAFLEQRPSGQYHLIFRFGGQRFKKALKTTQTDVADAARVRLDENLRLVAAWRLVIPDRADIPTFLMSDGKLNGKTHPRCKYTFCRRLITNGDEKANDYAPIAVDQATDLLSRCLAGTDWAKIRRWHVFRHSFISNCASKGIDQRMIDSWPGHQTEEMRRR